MRQYWDIKSLHQDKILLFRMGDFYEMFHDDAVKAAPILGIALTQRNKKSADETPMCGMPHHSVAGPINKLLKQGLKVAICDQIEDPKLAKGLVKRAVTRILTPGMVFDPDTLDQTMANYIASMDRGSLACVDTSTGEAFFFENLSDKDMGRLFDVLPIVELVLAPEMQAPSFFSGLVSYHDQDFDGSGPKVAQLLMSYVRSLSGDDLLKMIKPFEERRLEARLDLSSVVLRHLEVFSTYRGEGAGSLFHAIDRTKTSAGARLLRQWMSFPLTSQAEMTKRWDDVEHWTMALSKLKLVREQLSQMGDIERRLSRISQNTCNGRDLAALAQSLRAGLQALETAQRGIPSEVSGLSILSDEIERTIVSEPPLTTRQGHLIQKGFAPELDELIELSTNSQSALQKMENEEREKTGISSLKIRYNNVFGYYIEITNTNKDKVPASYLRKQTLANAERYCTDELIELEKKVLSADTKRNDLEFEIFERLRQKCVLSSNKLLHLAALTSELDVLTSLSWLAIERKYCRPQFSQSGELKLDGSRHPVVEQTVKIPFVPNDIVLSEGGCLLLTGPNMAGKSTIMRQVALSVILAQMGSFVPAQKATMPIFDHVFTRIGASDHLSEGLSTFMVEMTETAQMLKKATPKSLLILDEIGRGTSTFDGMSLAQAILEHLLSDLKAMTFFATHYHELTSLSQVYPQLKNAHMSVTDKNGEIRFLHTLTHGPAMKSYGIQVAKLAGLPSSVTMRAQSLLKSLSNQKVATTSQLSLLEMNSYEEAARWPEVSEEENEGRAVMSELIKSLQGFSVSQATPLEALNSIAAWQKTLNQQKLD